MAVVLRTEIPLNLGDVWIECPFEHYDGQEHRDQDVGGFAAPHPKTFPCENGLISLEQAILWTIEQVALAYRRP